MIVVDTNILAYLLIEGDKTAFAQELLRRDGDWHSEAFLLVEFSNLLATTTRSGRLPAGEASRLLHAAEVFLDGRMVFVAHTDALDVALRHSTSAYDARFLAAAMIAGRKLITEDARLRAAAPGLTLSLAEALGSGTVPFA